MPRAAHSLSLLCYERPDGPLPIRVTKTALTAPKSNFCFTPESGLSRTSLEVRFVPQAAHAPQQNYSITSSACASSVGGTVRPSAFAVLRLMTSSNFVGYSTGKSDGFSPLRILST